MPHYVYRAVDGQGIMNKGEMLAAHENDLYARLHGHGLNLIDCRLREQYPHIGFQKKLNLAEQVLLCRHLVMLTRAGVPVHTALEDVLPALPAVVRSVVSRILQDIIGGESLSSSFVSSALRFDPLFSLLLSAGEKTGKISQALEFLYETLNWKQEFTQKLSRALSYPMLQMLLAGTAVTVLMTVAVPQIIQLLETIGETLPFTSVVLLWTMNVFGVAAVVLAVLSFLTAMFLPLVKKLHTDIAETADRLFLSLPVIGALFNKVELAQITHVFAAMLGSGMPMMDALLLLPTLTPNRAMAVSLQQVARQVSSGQGLRDVLSRQLLIPAYVVRILKMGEDSGTLSDSLRHVSRVYQEESQQALDQLLKMTSLFITLAVGITLILMISGVMGPLYRGISHMVAA